MFEEAGPGSLLNQKKASNTSILCIWKQRMWSTLIEVGITKAVSQSYNKQKLVSDDMMASTIVTFPYITQLLLNLWEHCSCESSL
jgi:hypothetical protein